MFFYNIDDWIRSMLDLGILPDLWSKSFDRWKWDANMIGFWKFEQDEIWTVWLDHVGNDHGRAIDVLHVDC